MSEYREFRGKDVEDAMDKAAEELGLKKDELRYDILYHGSSGIFGLVGVKKAKIRVRMASPGQDAAPAKGKRNARGRKRSSSPEAAPAETEARPSAEAAPESGDAQTPKKAAKPRRRSRGRGKKSAAAKAAEAEAQEPASGPDADGSPEEQALDETAGASRVPAGDFDDGMSFDDNHAESASEEERERVAQVAVEAVTMLAQAIMEEPQVRADFSRPPQVTVIVEGPNSGIFIGRKGQNLEAVQYLVERIVLRRTQSRVRVQVDAGGYLARREEDLVRMAWRLAEKAKATGKAQSMPPMPAPDRQVIHLALAEDQEIRTHSKGSGPRRRLVIAPHAPKED
ncbi:MAG: Jag N-terminal domain-containing protein [Proteobacteria bacterium]|nr:Jag N-terminal domain-containing protein [Pseudomonadota bacterium]